MMRVCMYPIFQGTDQADGGIRRVVEALVNGLPAHGIDVVGNPEGADLIACHGTLWAEQPGVPVVSHNHGAYWAEYEFPPWAERANAAIRDALIRCNAATVPSLWVKQAYARAIWTPTQVIYHGIDAEAWQHNLQHQGYILWNKARIDSVSDPSPVMQLAARLPRVPFVSTFGRDTDNVKVTGALPYDTMRPIIQRAGVYLATCRETFGVGTLEAMAAGVPIVGWDYGGQAEIITNGETGYLVPVGDYAMLAEAIEQALIDRDALSRNCSEQAASRWGWADKIAQYADLYRSTLQAYHRPRPRIGIVITSYNLNQYLADAIRSALGQGPDVQVLVVDDCGAEQASEITKTFNDERLTLIRTTENAGLSAARNLGASLMDSRYLLFLDADDMLAPGAAHKLADALDHDRHLHIAAGRLETVNHLGLERRINGWPGAVDYRLQMLHLNQLHYAAMWRKETFVRTGGYRVRDWRAEDAALWCRAIGMGAPAELVTEESTLIYRMRSDSKSRTEAQSHTDRDGDWTYWFPWRLGAASGAEGAEMMARGARFDPRQVPFAAPIILPRVCWPIHHRADPLVSVIIPCGPGHDRYLVDALDSVFAQTFGNWECLVINDTGHEIDCAMHQWAQVTDTPGGLGAGAARNIGIRLARAPLVLFLDADDMLTPDCLQVLLRAYADSTSSYTYGDWLDWSDPHVDHPHEVKPTGDYDQMMALTSGYTEGRRGLHGVTALVETEAARAVNGFDPDLPGWEDWEFYLRLAAAGYCGERVPQPVLLYRTGTGSRRAAALEQQDSLRATIGARYAAYGEGTKMPRKCCGGMMTIKDGVNPQLEAAQQALPVSGDDIPSDNGMVRLRYVGPQQGEHSIFGVSGEIYRVGNNPHSRYANVKVGDVRQLLARLDDDGAPLFEVVR